MKPHHRIRYLAAVGALLLAASGCSTMDENPTSARTGRGYVDLYTEPKAEVWWKVDVYDSQGKEFRQYVAQMEAPAQGILRLEARPGHYKARVSFVNEAVEAPAEVELDVSEGVVTPIRVTRAPAGESFVRVTDDRFRRERSRTTDYAQQVWKISAAAQAPVPYTPKESMAYWK